MLRFMNFMAKDVRHNEFFDESRLKDVSQPIQRSNFLRLSDETDYLVDVIH